MIVFNLLMALLVNAVPAYGIAPRGQTDIKFEVNGKPVTPKTFLAGYSDIGAAIPR